MNIVMLGHSNAGKTTYMSMMYEAMSRGVDGFTVHAASETADRQLKRTARAIRRGRYPAPSDRRRQYNLHLGYNGDALIEFCWKDYRGGALTERTTSNQARQFLDDVHTADGIAAFVDVPELLSDKGARRKARTLSVLLGRALNGRDRVTPLAIALTKFDLVEGGFDIAQVGAPFDSLLRAASESDSIHATIFPLACGPKPENVTYPVLWCLSFGILSESQRVREQRDAALAQSRGYASQDTWFDRAMSALLQEPSYRKLAATQAQAALEYEARLETLIKPAEGLFAHLGELPYFGPLTAD